MQLRHPELATRSCTLCQKYQFDEQTGKMEKGRDGQPLLRLLDCGPEFHAPCRTEKGCPKGTPEKPKVLNAMNRDCYEHYLECRAVGQFPDDPVVRRNAVIIREVEDAVKRAHDLEFQGTMLRMVANR